MASFLKHRGIKPLLQFVILHLSVVALFVHREARIFVRPVTSPGARVRLFHHPVIAWSTEDSRFGRALCDFMSGMICGVNQE
jgi:hypothetical protein